MLFITTFNPADKNLKKILMKHWHLTLGHENLAQIYPIPQLLLIGRTGLYKIPWLEHNFLHLN